MKTIPKEEFVKIINKIKRVERAFADLNNFLHENRDVFTETDIWSLPTIDTTINSLAWAVGLDPNKEDAIWWWCYETNFGVDYKECGDDVPDEIDLGTAEGLYDYCIWLANKDDE